MPPKKTTFAGSPPKSASPPPTPAGPVSYPIGISIGTTSACVAFFKDGRSEIIANEDGERITPCCIAFTDEEMFAGTAAKNQLLRNRNNTVIEFTKLLGKSYDEVEHEKDWSHQIINKDGKPYYEVQYKGQTVRYSAVEMTSFMFKRMKEVAEAYLGISVDEVALNVPFGASEAYKKDLLDSAAKAHLKVLALVKDPIASLLAFGIGQSPEEFETDRNILVFDLGGLYLNITLIASFGGLFEIVKAEQHKIGGKDFDHKLMEHFAKEFKRKTKADLDGNHKALLKLRYASENTKRSLSSSATAHISVESLHDGLDFSGTINRSMFDMVVGPLTRQCMGIVQSVLDEVKLEPDSINEVLLVGGSTAMQTIQTYLEALFPNSKFQKDISPDEIVATGITFEASILAGEVKKTDEQETNAVPCDISIADAEGNMIPIIRKNSPVPIKRKKVLEILSDNQTSVALSFYGGEGKKAAENQKLIDIMLKDLKPTPKGEPRIEVTMVVEDNGKLKITVTDLLDRSKTVKVAL
jgi:heat shock protein 1/8